MDGRHIVDDSNVRGRGAVISSSLMVGQRLIWSRFVWPLRSDLCARSGFSKVFIWRFLYSALRPWIVVMCMLDVDLRDLVS
jgi:hypothetical protein